MLAKRAGHSLDLNRLGPVAMLAAMIAGFDGNNDQLIEVIRGLMEEGYPSPQSAPQCFPVAVIGPARVVVPA